jgi:hypothetical protein
MADSYPGARMLADRCWLYTALSRAETLAVTIGQREVLDAMCLKSHIWNRKTFLKEEILELQQQSIVQNWEAGLLVALKSSVPDIRLGIGVPKVKITTRSDYHG